jgi:hypothetical protein
MALFRFIRGCFLVLKMIRILGTVEGTGGEDQPAK